MGGYNLLFSIQAKMNDEKDGLTHINRAPSASIHTLLNPLSVQVELAELYHYDNYDYFCCKYQEMILTSLRTLLWLY